MTVRSSNAPRAPATLKRRRPDGSSIPVIALAHMISANDPSRATRSFPHLSVTPSSGVDVPVDTSTSDRAPSCGPTTANTRSPDLPRQSTTSGSTGSVDRQRPSASDHTLIV
ncbi:hypothetical protein SAMN02745121_05915 [Nannocystis exedens]|uniref:Uncharacterized protein n=1 Tax=Nannocystis exedens TaxID=54 RepID=A0A1I2E471_9BACT|nr:hypothetical protein NAEX_02294 [Nannocystis exedens]SFE87645.1 hypothetical protein SAMN02745121_05915 [Nannocystis exedens]